MKNLSLDRFTVLDPAESARLIMAAMDGAWMAHYGQTRKAEPNLPPEPYYYHPRRVAKFVEAYTHKYPSHIRDQMVMAAYMHDVVEDTHVTLDDLRETFPEIVCHMVDMLTEPKPVAGGPNRAARKEAQRIRLSGAIPEVQTIKYADLIDNSRSIVKCDPKFAPLYLKEKQALLESMTAGDEELYKSAQFSLVQAQRHLNEVLGLKSY